MRGEDARSCPWRRSGSGSPPHARGRPDTEVRPLSKPRITPACAGKTAWRCAFWAAMVDHPRMRGEDRRLTAACRLTSGSPPHARGRHLNQITLVIKSRITPACAGKTRPSGRTASTRPDHPRMRGEDIRKRAGTVRCDGSPPHARGRLRPPNGAIWARWITPACAGKTTTERLSCLRAADHPRMRGEDLTAGPPPPFNCGSPPHARGRPYPLLTPYLPGGITPACAGKTTSSSPKAASTEDHPRMRGEDRTTPRDGEGWEGSPPHARGRLPRPARETMEGRITPACAGKTRRWG